MIGTALVMLCLDTYGTAGLLRVSFLRSTGSSRRVGSNRLVIDSGCWMNFISRFQTKRCITRTIAAIWSLDTVLLLIITPSLGTEWTVFAFEWPLLFERDGKRNEHSSGVSHWNRVTKFIRWTALPSELWWDEHGFRGSYRRLLHTFGTGTSSPRTRICKWEFRFIWIERRRLEIVQMNHLKWSDTNRMNVLVVGPAKKFRPKWSLADIASEWLFTLRDEENEIGLEVLFRTRASAVSNQSEQLTVWTRSWSSHFDNRSKVLGQKVHLNRPEFWSRERSG